MRMIERILEWWLGDPVQNRAFPGTVDVVAPIVVDWIYMKEHDDNQMKVIEDLPVHAPLETVPTPNPWRDAVIDACVVDWIYTKEHDDNPRKAIGDLIVHNQRLALDPAVSAEAAELHRQIASLTGEVTHLQEEGQRIRNHVVAIMRATDTPPNGFDPQWQLSQLVDDLDRVFGR